MYPQAEMSGRSIHLLMEEIIDILKEKKERSIRGLSLDINAQWITVKKALDSLERLGLVKESLDNSNNRKTRLFSLK